MQPPRGRTHVLRYRRGEGNDVVLGSVLDFFDTGDIEPCTLTNVARCVRRDDTGARHRVGGCNLYLQPRFVLVLVAPDATHLRVGIACNHRLRITPARVAPSESAGRLPRQAPSPPVHLMKTDPGRRAEYRPASHVRRPPAFRRARTADRSRSPVAQGATCGSRCSPGSASGCL